MYTAPLPFPPLMRASDHRTWMLLLGNSIPPGTDRLNRGSIAMRHRLVV